MMNFLSLAVLFACACVIVETRHRNLKVAIGQKQVCFIKKSCVDCLQLSHCSWCNTSNKCFSNISSPEFCKNGDTHQFEDFGFSLKDNAKCICNQSAVEQNCHPRVPNKTALETESPCSGRGQCVCGRCVCETHANSTKMVMGEYCEFDNFSCNGPRCNEGPYSLNQLEQTDKLF